MKKMIFLIASAIMLTSCATVVHGTSANLKIKSESGQHIVLKDKNNKVIAQGKGEVVATVKRGDGAFNPAHYKVETPLQKLSVDSKVNTGAYIIGNFFIPGHFWGYIVDGANGAMYDLEVNGQPVESAIIR